MSEIDFQEFEHAKHRLPHKLYISKSFSYPGKETVIRYGWKRFEVGPLKELVKDGDEFVLRWSRLVRQLGGLAKVDRVGFYAANCSVISVVA